MALRSAFYSLLALLLVAGGGNAVGQTAPTIVAQVQAQAEPTPSTSEEALQRASSHLRQGLERMAAKRYKEALQQLAVAATLFEPLPPSEGKFQALAGLGDLQAKLGDYHQALTFHYKAQTIATALASQAKMATTLTSIGQDLLHLREYAQARDFLRQAATLHQAQGNAAMAAECLTALAEVSRGEARPLQAIQYDRQALAFYEQQANLPRQVQLTHSIGLTLMDLHNYVDAINLLQNALRLADSGQVGQERPGIYLGIAESYQGLGEPTKAAFYGSIALGLAQRGKQLGEQSAAHKVLSSAYQSQQKYEQSLRHYKSYVTLRDRVANLEQSRQVAEMRVRYEAEKKGKEIAVLQREKKIQELDIDRKENLVWMGLVLVGLLAVTAIMLYRKNIFEKDISKRLQQQNTAIVGAKAEIETQHRALSERTAELNDAMDRIKSSITYAKRIQEAMLPDHSLLARHFADPLIYFRPKDIVSGDFYWFAELDGKLIVVVADCTGHGVPGAFMSLIGHSTLTRVVAEDGGRLDPARILERLHQAVVAFLQQGLNHNRDGMDLGIAVYDPSSRQISFAGAKSAMVVVTDHEAIAIRGERCSVGGEGMRVMVPAFQTQTIFLEPGASFYLLTDGFADQFNASLERKFTPPRLRQLLQTIHRLPAAEQSAQLDQALRHWMGHSEQTDDILIVGLRIEPPLPVSEATHSYVSVAQVQG